MNTSRWLASIRSILIGYSAVRFRKWTFLNENGTLRVRTCGAGGCVNVAFPPGSLFNPVNAKVALKTIAAIVDALPKDGPIPISEGLLIRRIIDHINARHRKNLNLECDSPLRRKEAPNARTHGQDSQQAK